MLFGRNLRFEHEANHEGRDFVVGDLHGQRLMLEIFMEKIGFDTNKDRMFSVGDLCDRGPQSKKTLELVDESWFYPVVGNHEQMLYAWVHNEFSSHGRVFMRNGGQWAETVEFKELEELALKFEDVPRMRTIKKKNGKQVHIVHAELYHQRQNITDADIEDDEKLKSLCMIQDASFWGRNVFEELYDLPLGENPFDDPTTSAALHDAMNRATWFQTSLIISGHTIMREPIRIGNLLNIDTGAFVNGRPLTVYDINTEVCYQTRKVQDEYVVEEVEPFVFIVGKPKTNQN